MAAGDREVRDHVFFRNINWAKIEARQVQPPVKPNVVRKTDERRKFFFFNRVERRKILQSKDFLPREAGGGGRERGV